MYIFNSATTNNNNNDDEYINRHLQLYSIENVSCKQVRGHRRRAIAKKEKEEEKNVIHAQCNLRGCLCLTNDGLAFKNAS